MYRLASTFSLRPIAVILLSWLLAAPAATSIAQINIRAREADRFVDSMGINVHMEYAGTPYQNYAAINEKLQALGMRHFRDEINDTTPSFVDEINSIGKLGYSLCGLIAGGNDYPAPGQRLEADLVVPMIHNLQPTIEAVEGPNEPDNKSFLYDGTQYPKGAIQEAKDLSKIVKGSSEISALPVIVLSEGNAQDFTTLAAITPPPIDYATYGNMHAYQGGGLADQGLADFYIPYSRDLTAKDSLWTTEMGYHNNTKYLGGGEQQGVSQRAAAIYLPIAFLSGFGHGVLRTFSYELVDEANDPHLIGRSGEGHYGILNYDLTPKPAYTALKNLVSLLQDPSRENFIPGSLTVTFSGAPGTMRYTLLQKSMGTYYLALWNDVSVYEVATKKVAGKDLYPSNTPVTLSFSTENTFTVYAPNDATGTNPTTKYTISASPNAIALNLPPHVLLLEIQP
jgi:hypothetical protein